MMKKYLKILLATAVILFGEAVHAASIPITTHTTDGTVPGTGITYTITNTGDGGPRNIFGPGSSTNSTWSWSSFPEYLAYGSAQMLTVSFSAPVPLNRLVFGILSTSNSSNTLTISGGNATLADFNLFDNFPIPGAEGQNISLDTVSGAIPSIGGNNSLFIGSNSSNTIDGFTIQAGASNSGTDGYTVFFGTTDVAATPIPGAVWLFGTGIAGLVAAKRKKANKLETVAA